MLVICVHSFDFDHKIDLLNTPSWISALSFGLALLLGAQIYLLSIRNKYVWILSAIQVVSRSSGPEMPTAATVLPLAENIGAASPQTPAVDDPRIGAAGAGHRPGQLDRRAAFLRAIRP